MARLAARWAGPHAARVPLLRVTGSVSADGTAWRPARTAATANRPRTGPVRIANRRAGVTRRRADVLRVAGGGLYIGSSVRRQPGAGHDGHTDGVRCPNLATRDQQKRLNIPPPGVDARAG
jgi:hypothetical protein